MNVHIGNLLRIYEGDILLIPGCEPVSTVTFSSTVWAQNPYVETIYTDNICPASYITLERAREAIPDGEIVYLGSTGLAYKYFRLPDGPPTPYGCPCGAVGDWYQILRDNADTPEAPEETKKTLSEICQGFGFDFCGRS